MLDTTLQDAAETFVRTLQVSEEFERFRKAQKLFQGDPELREIRKQFNNRSTELQSKQTAGTLTQDEIDELRALQSNLNKQPATVHYIVARQQMVAALQECNRALSEELGFDFAAAAPRSCCG